MVLWGWGGSGCVTHRHLREPVQRLKTSPSWAGLRVPSQLCLLSEGSEAGRSVCSACPTNLNHPFPPASTPGRLPRTGGTGWGVCFFLRLQSLQTTEWERARSGAAEPEPKH